MSTNSLECPTSVTQAELPAVFTATASPRSNNGGHIPYFHSLLCQWPYGFPLTSFWIVLITPNNSSYLTSQLEKIGDLEIKGSSSNGSSWQISEGLNYVTHDDVSNVIGCSFATGYSAPGESLQVEYAGIQNNNRGFLRGPIISGRNNPATFQISFSETNSSFVENFIRPWTILTAHKGLFAYEESIKATITVYEYRKAGWDQDPKVRKRWTYFDSTPTDFGSYDSSRAEQTTPEERTCQFTYNGYTVSDGSDV